MPFYYVNNDKTKNPGLHHEVHTEEHAKDLNIANKHILDILLIDLGLLRKQNKFTVMLMDVQHVVHYVIKDKQYYLTIK